MTVKVTKPQVNVRETLADLAHQTPWCPPSFRADLNSVQTVTDATWETYEADQVYWDTHGTYDATSFTYVIPVSGIYMFLATQWWSNKPEGRTISRLLINGTAQSYDYHLTGAGSSWTHQSMHSLNAGDTVQLQVNQSSGSSQNMDPSDLNNGWSGVMVSGHNYGRG